MKSIKKELAVATCTLLSQSADVQALENAWELDSSYLFYSEADDRVTVHKFVGKAGGDVSDRDRVNITAVLDTMSGATPSGAVKQSVATFSGASGGGSGGTSPNTNALAKFDDTRAGMAMSWAHSHENNWELVYGGAVSVENDYRSFSGSFIVNKETQDKAYKFSLGLAGTIDEIFRVGSGETPLPLSAIEDDLFLGEGEKDTIDIIAGITHIINRRTVGQINLSYSVSNGYLTDPYKVFSVVDINTGIADRSYYESRPTSRERISLSMKVNHQTFPSNNTVHLAYRYYTDDWDVDSHTIDFAYRFNYADAKYLEPKVRLYHQSQASFYQNEFFAEVEGNIDAGAIPSTFPTFISADYRLDEFNSITPEIHYGTELGSDDHFRMRLAYMYQAFENAEFDTNKAIIFQIAYNKRF